jgi:hypothetical protein
MSNKTETVLWRRVVDMFTESSANPMLHLALEADWKNCENTTPMTGRGTHHEHPLLQVSVDAIQLHVTFRDSSSRDIGRDQVNRRVDCGVCWVNFGSAHAGGEIGED